MAMAMAISSPLIKSIALPASLSLNLLLFLFFLSPFSSHTPPTTHLHLQWTHAASAAAEEAAIFNCSHHGNLYVDTFHPASSAPPTDRELKICECFDCFTGPHCADFVPNCDADVDSGDPLLFEPFWRQNAEVSAVLIPGWYRMSYTIVEGNTYTFTPALERQIRLVHKLAGNAVTQGRYILLGTGSMQLLNAAVASLSPQLGNPASVVAGVPYYGTYRSQTEMFQTSHYTWIGDAWQFAQSQVLKDGLSIEFVTSPNNPDATLRGPILNGTHAQTIYDHVYYWPHFTSITKALEDDIMLFSLSKLTGHAGSRLGWAIVKDEAIYQRMLQYVRYNTVTISHESQFRATQLIKVINDGYSKLAAWENLSLTLQPAMLYATNTLIFHYAYGKLSYRWETLNEILKESNRFKLQHLEPQYCSFFKKVTQPSPAYAWIRCEREDEGDCLDVFLKYGIIGRGGDVFGADKSYIRLSLLKRDSTFENLVNKLTHMLSTLL